MNAAVLLAYDPNDVKPGWVALGLVVALAVATFLLWRSMNSQLRKIQLPPKQTGRSGTPRTTPDHGLPDSPDSAAGESAPDEPTGPDGASPPTPPTGR